MSSSNFLATGTYRLIGYLPTLPVAARLIDGQMRLHFEDHSGDAFLQDAGSIISHFCLIFPPPVSLSVYKTSTTVHTRVGTTVSRTPRWGTVHAVDTMLAGWLGLGKSKG